MTEPSPTTKREQQLASQLTTGSPERTLDGNDPFRLDGSGALLFVAAGEVEVFAVPHGAPGVGARRTHVGTIGAGELLLGLGAGRRQSFATADAPPEVSLLAVGQPGARVHELGSEQLKEVAREGELTLELAGLVDRWLGRLYGRLVEARPPKVFAELVPGEQIDLEEAGAVARPRGGVTWVRHLAGTSTFLGHPRLVMDAGGFLLPVVDGTWLVSESDVRLSCVDTENLLRAGTLWEGLERMHRLFLDYVEERIHDTDSAERERLGQQRDIDERAMAAAGTRLASILSPTIGLGIEVDQGSDALLAACRLVGEAQGLTISAPTAGEAEVPERFRLARICAASRVRSRQVLLREDWWRHDNGPLLGSLSGETEGEPPRPVALLPVSPRRYELVDLERLERVPVDAEQAALLDPNATTFYTPLPDRPLRAWDLVSVALGRRGRDFATILLLGVGGGILALLIPVVTGFLFGHVIPSADRSLLLQMTLALLVGALAQAAFQITRSIAVVRLSGKVDGALQSAVWDRLLSLPVPFFRDYTVGDLADRAMGVDGIRQLLTGYVLTAFLGAVFSIFSVALLFYYSSWLALVAIGLVVVLVVTTTVLALLQLRHQRAQIRVRGQLSSLLLGLVNGISKLHVAGAERRAYALWAERFTEQRRHTIAARRLANLQASFNAGYAVLSVMALFAVVVLAQREELSVADFLAFNAAYGQFQAATLAFIGVLPSLLGAVPLYERLQPILQAVPEVDATKVPVSDLAGDIEFSHVAFRYAEDGPLILDETSFLARPGEFVALVGSSGAGKSTCFRLLLGFEQPSSGSIYYDGQDLPSLDLESVRRQIGVVLQNGRPMIGDILSNIVGSRNLTIDDAWEAARMAGLEDDIREMPMQMHTIISEGGGTFSGGQIQRLLVCRAIVHRPRVILFDEATSALDNRSQAIVSRSLERLKATRIVIAHRLSTIRNADRIYVLDKGRVVAAGRYEELIRAGGLFARMAERQIA